MTSSQTARNRLRRRNMSVARGAGTGLQNDLLFIIRPYDLEDSAQIRISVGGKQQDFHVQDASQAQRALLIGGLSRKCDRLGIELLGLRHCGDLPSQGHIDGDVIGALERKLEVDRVSATGVIKEMFLRRGK